MYKSPIQKIRTAADEEAALLDAADAIMEKSAATVDSTVPARRDFVPDDADRLEERVTPPPSPDEEEEEEEYSSTVWGDKPSVRDQAIKHPSTVRMTDPETKVFKIADETQLREFNRIQKGTADPEAPTYAISEIDKSTIPGSWVVTFYKILYQKI